MASQTAAYAQELLAKQAAANASMPPSPAVADLYAASATQDPPELQNAQFLASLNKDATAQGDQEAKAAMAPYRPEDATAVASQINGSPALTPEEVDARDKAEFAKTLPPGMIMDPTSLVLSQAKTQQQGLANNERDLADAKKYAEQKQALDVQQAEKAQPLLNDMATQNQASYDRQKAAHDQVQKEMDARLTHYKSVQDEMTKIANEKPQDLFGQAGVNRVLGSIALFFGGAGMAGFGPNHALETFNNMADRNIASQREHYERLAKIGMQDQSMYGMLVQKLQSTDAAEAAMRNAYATLAESKAKAYANEFAKPQAKLDAQKFIMAAQAEKRKNDLAVAQAYQGQALAGMQIIATQEAARNKEIHAGHRDMMAELQFGLESKKYADAQSQQNQATQIGGFSGNAPPKDHARLAKVAGGARTLIDMLGQMRKMVGKHMSPAQLRAFSTAQAINTMGARQFFETGTRLEEGENKQIATVALSQLDNLFFQLQNATSGTDVAALLDKIEDTQALLTRATNMTVTTAAPGMHIDKSDKVWGRFDPDDYKSSWEKETLETEGTPEGAKELGAMPDYNPDKAVSTQEQAADILKKRYGSK